MRYFTPIAILVLTFTASCGGSGGDATPIVVAPPTSGFLGSYFVAALAGTSGDEQSSSLEWGMHFSDGSTLQGSSDQNAWNTGDPTLDNSITLGLARGPDPILSGDFGRVVADGLKCFDGAISDTGDVVALTSLAAGDDPAICLMVRPGAAVGDSALSGAFHFVGIAHSQSPQSHQVFSGTAIFDGAGGGTVDLITNTNGTITGPSGPLAMTYSFADPGRLTFSILSAATFEGALTGNGDLVVLAGDTTTATPGRALIILIRKSTAATFATLRGTYRSVEFAPLVGTGWDGDGSTRQADGFGSLLVREGSRNGDGIIYPRATGGTLPYTVAPDGTLRMIAVGGVSADGRFAAVAQMTPGIRPRLSFLLRYGP